MAVDHMTTDEKEFADRVFTEVLKYKKSGANAIFDLALAHRLGFTPEETAEAIIGINKRVVDILIAASPKDCHG